MRSPAIPYVNGLQQMSITEVFLCLFPLPDLEKSPRIEIIGERLFKVTTCFLTKKTKVRLCTSSKTCMHILVTRLCGEGSEGGQEVEEKVSSVVLCSFLIVLSKRKG